MLGKVNRLSPALSYTVIEMKNGVKMQLCVVPSVADRAISRVQIRCIDYITGKNLREESSTQAMLLENVHDEWNAVTLRPDEAHDGAVRTDRSPAGVFPGTAQGTFRINRNVNVDDGGYLVTSATRALGFEAISRESFVLCASTAMTGANSRSRPTSFSSGSN